MTQESDNRKEPGEISAREENFQALAAEKTRAVLGLIPESSPDKKPATPVSPSFIGKLLFASAELEEFLDAVGAGNNRIWFPFRETVAATKNLAEATRILVHLRNFSTRYSLLDLKNQFRQDTEDLLESLTGILNRTTDRLRKLARELDLGEGDSAAPGKVTESPSPGRLPADRECPGNSRSTPEHVVSIATAFLTLASESEPLHQASKLTRKEYSSLIPNVLNEEILRRLEYKFHNLQSSYDTYIAVTDTERSDDTLPVLRGHIATILHLVQIAVVLVHYVERHVVPATRTGAGSPIPLCLDEPEKLIDSIVNYCSKYSRSYLLSARNLCHRILRRYAKMSTVALPVPVYRGFHVRPASLVASIVQHYGCDVTMELWGERYDAGSALELFRANERINAKKRQQLNEEILSLPSGEISPTGNNTGTTATIVRRVVLKLAEQGKVRILEHPLPLGKIDLEDGQTVAETITKAIARLLMTGKLDIEAETMVSFHGNEWVLRDIRTLADHGYCEDSFGNDTPIPPELRYIRRAHTDRLIRQASR